MVGREPRRPITERRLRSIAPRTHSRSHVAHLGAGAELYLELHPLGTGLTTWRSRTAVLGGESSGQEQLRYCPLRLALAMAHWYEFI